MKNNVAKIIKMDKRIAIPFGNCGANEMLTLNMFKWFKLVEICMVHVLKFIEDEQCFSIFVFIKNKVCNQLNTHIDLYVKMFGHTFFTLEISCMIKPLQLRKKKFHRTIEA